MIWCTSVPGAARRAQAFAAGVSRDRYDAEEAQRLALAFLVQNVGEAASKVPADLRAKHLEIDWAAITGMRHRIVHDYVNINFERLWEVVQTDLPALIAALEQITPSAPPSA